ncbi:MAG: hypothetical protein WDO15_02350 [Bacteroidota bacterium]
MEGAKKIVMMANAGHRATDSRIFQKKQGHSYRQASTLHSWSLTTKMRNATA